MTDKLSVPYEVEEVLDKLNPYVKVCFYELISGKSLVTFNQRRYRAISSNLWEKYVNIGLAVELYKHTKLMNDKKAV